MTPESSGSPFEGTASYYARFRVPYPAPLIEDIVREFRLDGSGRLLDLGCGPGPSTLPFRPVFEEIVGVDADPEMIEEARRQSDAAGADNARFVCMRAEEISPELGNFRLVTLGASFHWMEQERVLRLAHDLTTAGGGIAIFGMPSWWQGQQPWQRAIIGVVRKWLGDERRAGSTTFSHPPKRYEVYLEESPFADMKSIEHHFSHSWTVDSIIGLLYSTSFAAKRLFGDQAESFEEDIRGALLEISPEGTFREELTADCLIAWKR